MSRQKSHTPRSLCKSLKQMHQIAKSMHYQQDFSCEDNRFMYDIYEKCHRIMNEVRIKYDLDINNDFRPKGVDKSLKRICEHCDGYGGQWDGFVNPSKCGYCDGTGVDK